MFDGYSFHTLAPIKDQFTPLFVMNLSYKFMTESGVNWSLVSHKKVSNTD